MTEISITSTADADGVTRLAVAGEIDMDSSERLAASLREAILDGPPKQVAVDMFRVTFIDSTGIRALVVAHEFASAHGVAFYVTNPHRHVRRVLDLTQVFTLLTDQDPAPPPGDTA